MEKQPACPICGHTPLRRTLIDRTFEYGSDEEERITVHATHVPVDVCDGCGETFTGPEAAKVEHEAICRTLRLPTPSEVVSLRERLGLSQSDFAELTGIGKATISRWERGRMLPNRAMARYLSLLDDRENLDRLRRASSKPQGCSPRPEATNERMCEGGSPRANRVFRRAQAGKYAAVDPRSYVGDFELN